MLTREQNNAIFGPAIHVFRFKGQTRRDAAVAWDSHAKQLNKAAGERKHAPLVLRIEVSDSKRLLRFHHKADCSKSTPDTMRCLRLIGDPNCRDVLNRENLHSER